MRHTLRRAALLTSGAGIGFGVLTVGAWWLLGAERAALIEADDPFAHYQAEGNAGATIAGLYLLPIASILFLWFNVALRGWIRGTQRRRNMLISDVQLVAGITFTAVFLVGAAAVATPVIVTGAGTDAISYRSLLAMSAVGNTLMVVMAFGWLPSLSSHRFPGHDHWSPATVVQPAQLRLRRAAHPGPHPRVGVDPGRPGLGHRAEHPPVHHMARLADDGLPGFTARYVDTSVAAER